jgi:hypothetical protein
VPIVGVSFVGRISTFRYFRLVLLQFRDPRVDFWVVFELNPRPESAAQDFRKMRVKIDAKIGRKYREI